MIILYSLSNSLYTNFIFRVETSWLVLNLSTVWNLRHCFKIGNADTKSEEETNTT